MASVRLTDSQVYPAGTVVRAYAVPTFPGRIPPEGAPPAAAVVAASGTVLADGECELEGLAYGTRYAAAGEVAGVWRWVTFTTAALTADVGPEGPPGVPGAPGSPGATGPPGPPGATGNTVFNVQEYIAAAAGAVMTGYQNAINAAEAAGGGVVLLTGDIVIPKSTPRATSLTIKSSNVIIDLGGHAISYETAPSMAFESLQERLFKFEGTAGATFTVAADIQEGASTLSATGMTQPADGTSLLVTSTRRWDPEGVNSTLAEIVVAGVPDGPFGSSNGAAINSLSKIAKGETVNSIKIGFIGGSGSFPASGVIQIGTEQFEYTSVSVEANVTTFTLVPKVAAEEHKRGARVFLIPPVGTIFLSTHITQEGAAANTAGQYTLGVAFAVADAAKVKILNMVENVVVRNGRIIGGGYGQVQSAVNFSNCHNVRVDGVRFENFEFQSVSGSQTTFGTVTNCRTEHSKNTNLAGGLTGYGVNLSNTCQDWVVERHRHSSARHCVTMGGTEGQTRRVTLRDSFILNTGAASVDSHGSGIDYTIENNILIGEALSIECPTAIIRGNKIYNTFAVSIFCNPQGKGTANYVITDNLVIGSQSDGILVQSTSGATINLTTVAGETAAVLASSPTGLEVGMPITSAGCGVAFGTIITAISGLNITLSKAASKTATEPSTILRGSYNIGSILIANNVIQKAAKVAIEVKMSSAYSGAAIIGNAIRGTASGQGIKVKSGQGAIIAGNSITESAGGLVAIELENVANSTITGNTLNTGTTGINMVVGTTLEGNEGKGNTVVGNTINKYTTGVKLDNNTTFTIVGRNNFLNTATPVTLGTGEGNFNENAELANVATPAETVKANTEAITKLSEALKKARITL